MEGMTMGTIEQGSMVSVSATEHAEKMAGIVGLVTEVMAPAEDGSTGEETLYRVEFFSNRLRLPPNLPTWWPAGDLKVEE